MRTILTTRRALLREMHAGDLDAVAALLGDPEVMRFWPRTYSRQEAAIWIARQQERYARHGHGYWLMLDRAEGTVLGQAGLVTLILRSREEVALGYIIGRPFWGRGYATEAAAACRDHALETTPARRVIALIQAGNLASVAVARRIGMRPTGRTMYAGLDHLVYAVRREAAARIAGGSAATRGAPRPGAGR